MFDIIFNDQKGEDNGAWVVQRPDIPAPTLRTTIYDIAGRDGELVETDDTYEPIEIEVPLNFYSRQWSRAFRKAKKWLLGRDGNMRLFFNDDMQYFYKVDYVRIGTSERLLKKIGTFTATFICDPYMYRVDGLNEYAPEEVYWNPYARCHPTFIISGTDSFELTVNGNVLKGTARGKFTVDTDLFVAYEEAYNVLADGDDVCIADEDNALILMASEVTEVSEYLDGDYEEMWLEEGENTVYCTGEVELTVIPNWREL